MTATNDLNMRDFIPSNNLNADFFRDCTTFTSLTTASRTIFRRMPDLKRQIPKEFGDPVQVWDALQPEVNVGRFLTYIEWLSEREAPLMKFHQLRKERHTSVQNCLNALDVWAARQNEG